MSLLSRSGGLRGSAYCADCPVYGDKRRRVAGFLEIARIGCGWRGRFRNLYHESKVPIQPAPSDFHH